MEDTVDEKMNRPDQPAQDSEPGDQSTQTLLRPTIESASATSTPLSSAPPTPRPKSPSRRGSQTAWHPPSPYGNASPRAQAIRRTSSAFNLDQRSASPALKRSASRSSLGGNGPDAPSPRRLTPRRSISNLTISGAHAKMDLGAMQEEPPPLTAAKVATDYFAKALATHDDPANAAETVVILHDACYGHRFSRPKTTKGSLSMIVERPERILASVLGASTAYVRLGGHHAGGSNAPHPARDAPAQPPFRIRRTARAIDVTSTCVTNVHGMAWMSELRSMCDSAATNLANGGKELTRHPPVADTTSTEEPHRLHEGDLYLCPESLDAFQGALGGVCEAIDSVFMSSGSTKKSFVAIRPPGHHCSSDWPSGFCWLNNVHVGIEYAHQTFGLTHAAIIDFDLHHGDGSQAVTWERNSKNNAFKPGKGKREGPRIGYYSLHDINSYPCEMGDDEKVQAASLCVENAHGQSIWNVHLQSWRTEDEFWELYESRYKILLEKARVFLRHHAARLQNEKHPVQPRSAIFISAGFDASEWEGAGMQRHKVNVPTGFYARFTSDIVGLANEDGTGCDGRVISVLEGGYSDRALASGVLSHLSGLCSTATREVKREPNGLADEMHQRMSSLSLNGTNGISEPREVTYDQRWWSGANLTALENRVNPPPPPQAKKIRTGPQPTYATPTESFTQKVVDQVKFARSVSGTMREVYAPPRPPTPPPPEVDWVTAAHELSKLLIPADRQTRSCTAEELAGPRVKKERQSAAPVLTTEQVGAPRELRQRKAKVPSYTEPGSDDDLSSLRSVSRSSRRQTIADFLPSAAEEKPVAKRANRRLSAASTLTSASDFDAERPPVPSLPMGPPAVPKADVLVKKTRAPPKVKANDVKIAKAAAAYLQNGATELAQLATPSNGTVADGSQDMEQLTSGLKKITLKVGTREEHDRKMREKEVAEKKGKAGVKKVAAAATKKAPPKLVKSAGNVLPAEAGVSQSVVADKAVDKVDPSAVSATSLQAVAELDRPVLHVPKSSEQQQPQGSVQSQTWPADSQTYPGADRPITATTPLQHSMANPSATQPAQQEQSSTPPSSTPVVPDSAARQLLHEHHAAFQAPPPISSPTRSPSNQLPIWSSTGSIPFAKPLVAQSVPNSPMRETQEVRRVSGTGVGNGVSRSMLPPPRLEPVRLAEQEEKKESEGEADVWAVPETPQR